MRVAPAQIPQQGLEIVVRDGKVPEFAGQLRVFLTQAVPVIEKAPEHAGLNVS
jgi:hypothetical protein